MSYTAKHRLRTALKVILIVLLIAAAAIAALFLYLKRYIVYTKDGAVLNFQPDAAADIEPSGAAATVPTDECSIVVEESRPEQIASEESVERLTGYYINISMLQDPAAVLETVKSLEAPSTVLIDLKSSSGKFYYSTDIEGAERADIDVTVVDSILSYLKSNGFTVIARVEAFRDSAYALANQKNGWGLAISGGYLWSDSGYYWLDPGEEKVLFYLQQIAKDLSGRGIHEVVFNDFYFPESPKIIYRHSVSTSELINNTAEELIRFFDGTNMVISFGNTTSEFSLSGTDSRVYLDNSDASKVGIAMNSFSGISSPETQIVFMTNSKDTRFEQYNVLKPLIQN